MNIDSKKIRHMIDAISRLPRVEAPMSEADNLWHHYKLIRCKSCGGDYDKSHYSMINTGYMVATDMACKECRKDAAGTVPIVCVQCKSVVLRIEPYKDRDGFEFQRNRAYHVDACPDCSKGLESSMVVEKKIFIQEKYK